MSIVFFVLSISGFVLLGLGTFQRLDGTTNRILNGAAGGAHESGLSSQDVQRLALLLESRLSERAEWQTFINDAVAAVRAQPLQSGSALETIVWLLGVIGLGYLGFTLLSKKEKTFWGKVVGGLALFFSVATGFFGLVEKGAKAYIAGKDAWRWSPPQRDGSPVVEPVHLLRRSEVPPRFAVFPLLFSTNAKKTGDAWTDGVQLSPAQKESLSALIGGLAACADDKRDISVHIRVEGFASSAEFRNEPFVRSRPLNLDAANQRARNVSDYMKQVIHSRGLDHQIVIDVPDHWTSFEEMEARRPYNDKPESADGRREQELFNRVAQVRMIRAGSCEPLSDSESSSR